MALFEPIHGSAPDIAGQGIANPIGAIRSAAMMMEWLGEQDTARRMEEAVQKSLEAAVLTPDLGGSFRTEDVTRAVKKYLSQSE